MDNGKQAVGALAVIAAFLVVLAAPPFIVTAANSFSLAPLSPVEAMVGTVRIAATDRWSDPRAAYQRSAGERMPPGVSWWLALLAPGAALAGGAALLAGPVDVLTTRRHLARRWWDPRGFRPRSDFARARDVRRLQVARRSGDRMTLGTLDGKLLAADDEAMVALCGPTGAGKTTRFVIPWVLEADGPVLVSTTKPDVENLTAGRRAGGGPVWSFDPFGDPRRPNACCWDPLEECEQWGRALRQAKWLADAASHPQATHLADFWDREAARLLAPLLHAAALAGESIGKVVEWLDTQDRRELRAILKSDGDDHALTQLEGVLALDSRNQSTTYMSAASLLEAYRYPRSKRLREAASGRGISSTEARRRSTSARRLATKSS